MSKLQFKAYAVTNEIDLNKIASECNIRKKYTWEEPLLLQGEVLKTILGDIAGDEEKIRVFSFGSIVFINSTKAHENRFIHYLKRFKPEIDAKGYEKFQEDLCAPLGRRTGNRVYRQLCADPRNGAVLSGIDFHCDR